MSFRSTVNQLIYYPIGVFRLYCRIHIAKSIKKTAKRIYLLNIPSHGNLGDHLLSISEQQFFRDNFPQYELVLVSSADLYYSVRIALSKVKKDDILCVTGGGFLGSLYAEEHRFLKILKLFPHNKVIVLPQTIYYENNFRGQNMLCQAAKQYEKHKHLYVVARDKRSYDLLVNSLMNGREDHIAFTPDLALYLKRCAQHQRDGVLWCLRGDSEVNPVNKTIVKQLQAEVGAIGINEKYTDTYVNYTISLNDELAEVEKKIDEISHAQLVITDRLHGMIYSVITGTPVIVMDNINGKVKQVYEQWINHIPYIRFIDDAKNSSSCLCDMLRIKSTDYLQDEVISKYQPIIDFINAKD